MQVSQPSPTRYSAVDSGDAEVDSNDTEQHINGSEAAQASRFRTLLVFVLPLLGVVITGALYVMIESPSLHKLLPSFLSFYPSSLSSFSSSLSFPSSSPSSSSCSSSSSAIYRQFHPVWARMVPTASDVQHLRAEYDRMLNESDVCSGVLSGVERGVWSLNEEYELHWNPSHCRLRRPSQSEALQCLSSQSLWFIGDSLTRYQYMSLIVFLSSGQWPEPLGSIPDSPNPTLEREWHSWDAYYKASSNMSSGLETCMCERDSAPSWQQWVERRHWYHPAADLTIRALQAPLLDSVLAALEEVVEEAKWVTPASGSSSSNSSSSNSSSSGRTSYKYTAHCVPQLCASSFHSSCAYLADVPFRPSTAVVVNTGLWQTSTTRSGSPPLRGDIPRPFSTGDPSFYAPIRDYQHSQQPGSPRLIWKMTTAKQGMENGESDPGCYAAQTATFNVSEWDILDVFSMAAGHAVIKDAYWDDSHYLPFMYEEMNTFLLNTLCTPDWTFVGKQQRTERRAGNNT